MRYLKSIYESLSRSDLKKIIRFDPETECKKTAYGTKEFAEKDLIRLNRKSKRLKKPKRVYKCEFCDNWHLTSREDELHIS